MNDREGPPGKGGRLVQHPRGQVMGAGTGTGHPPSASGGRAGPRLLEWRSRRRASAFSTERGCTRTPEASAIRSGSCAGRSAGSAASCSSAQARISSVSLLAPRGPGRAGTSPSSPEDSSAAAARVVRGAGVPERRGGRGDRGAAGLDLAHHLVLDLHRVPGVEEVAGQELRVGHLLGVRVRAPRGGGQRRLLGVVPALLVGSPLVWPLFMLLTCPLASCPEKGQSLFVSTDVANSWAACTTTMSAAEVPAASTCGLARSRENWPLAWPHR